MKFESRITDSIRASLSLCSGELIELDEIQMSFFAEKFVPKIFDPFISVDLKWMFGVHVGANAFSPVLFESHSLEEILPEVQTRSLRGIAFNQFYGSNRTSIVDRF